MTPFQVRDGGSPLWPSKEVCSLIADALSLPPTAEIRLHPVAADVPEDDAQDVDAEDDGVLLRCASCGTAFECGLRTCGCNGATSRTIVSKVRPPNSHCVNERARKWMTEAGTRTQGSSTSGTLLQKLRTAASRQSRGKGGRGSVQVIWEKQQSACDSPGSTGSDVDLAGPLPEPPQPQLAVQAMLPEPPRKRRLAEPTLPTRKRARPDVAQPSISTGVESFQKAPHGNQDSNL
ncbi:uncharacterized protein LOC117643995 [Thrips palmi]|uniref:Uncharacterized protein LOC117643995 n=1 Tax=Thrips palmi TaxID=161013 RepID=A0A6P8YH44_THRPL|nr:uncharacterized protein LOC117643995 [Thrips palmi]